MSNQPPQRPGDDDAYTIDTRIGGRRPPRRTPPVQSTGSPERPVYTTDPEWRDGVMDDGTRPGEVDATRSYPAASPTGTRPIPTDRPTGRRAPMVDPRAEQGTDQLRGGRPAYSDPREAVTGTEPAPTRPRRRVSPRMRRRRIWSAILLTPLLLALVYGGWMYLAANSAWGQVTRVDATPDSDRPAAGKGKNFLLVGSDGKNLTPEQRKKLGMKTYENNRTDSLMLVHVPEEGKTVMVSIPRDSYVEVPGHDPNKINAAYSLGGPELLVATVEKNTGLRVDGYLEIGFGGFADVVDAVGGVRICVKAPMKDADAHINLKAGCQRLNGKNALGYVRARKCDTCGNDFGRMERQREFLAALVKKTATKENMFLPWRVSSVGGSIAKTLTVGEDDSMWQTYKLLQALRGAGDGNSIMLQVPNNGGGYMVRGMDTVLWDENLAPMLWQALREDSQLPNLGQN